MVPARRRGATRRPRRGSSKRTATSTAWPPYARGKREPEPFRLYLLRGPSPRTPRGAVVALGVAWRLCWCGGRYLRPAVKSCQTVGVKTMRNLTLVSPLSLHDGSRVPPRGSASRHHRDMGEPARSSRMSRSQAANCPAASRGRRSGRDQREAGSTEIASQAARPRASL